MAAATVNPPRPVAGLGWDVAAPVDATAPDVTTFTPGDRVIALSDRLPLSLKTRADYAILDTTAVALLPPDTNLTAAATLPLAALTAAQSLDLTGLGAGRTLLVTGAAGAVGGYVVELAVRAGIRVVAVGAGRDRGFLTEVGAGWVVGREVDDLGSAVRELVPGGVDAVVDAASLGMPALDAVRGGGAFVALLAGRAPVGLRGIRVANVWIRADGPRLAELAGAGLHLRVAGTLPLEEVAEAHRRMEKGGLRGRLVLIP